MQKTRREKIRENKKREIIQKIKQHETKKEKIKKRRKKKMYR